MDHILKNIPTEPVVRGSEESSQPLKSRRQMFKEHSTSVAQLPAPYKDRSLSTTGASLRDDQPRTHIRTHLPKRKEDERNQAGGKAKRQRTSMKLDTKGKRHRGKRIAKEIFAKESSDDTDTDDSVVVDDDVAMSESRATLPPSDRNSCRSSIEKPMDIPECH